jgi:hypothetical protein
MTMIELQSKLIELDWILVQVQTYNYRLITYIAAKTWIKD